jgi:RNA ligase (TIGR02306 family)
MPRKLSTIRVIDALTAIPNADRIVTAHIGGWPVVVSKGYFNVGDHCVYFEPDAMLPLSNPVFAPLEGRGKTKDNTRGESCVVLKTAKFRGQLSQGFVASPVSLGLEPDLPVGTCLDDVLGVEKYDPPEIQTSSGVLKDMPGFISKTEELRVQNLDDMVAWLTDHPDVAAEYHASEKLDGASATYYRHEDGDGITYGVCSHVAEIKDADDDNEYWLIASKYDMHSVLDDLYARHPGRSIAVQGEITGPGIRKNRLGFKDIVFHVFNVIIDGQRYDPADAEFGLDDDIIVPQLDISLPVDTAGDPHVTMQNIIDQAYGRKSTITKDRLAEGIVWRYDGDDLVASSWNHFKSLNNKYLLKD